MLNAENLKTVTQLVFGSTRTCTALLPCVMRLNAWRVMNSDYKEAQVAVERLKAGDVRGIEPAIKFLKTDIYESRSGYLKEYLWRYLNRVPLSDRQRQRLLEVARKYLARRMTREFRSMCRLVHRIADEEFNLDVQSLAESASDVRVRRRAQLLCAYIQSLDDGEKLRFRSG